MFLYKEKATFKDMSAVVPSVRIYCQGKYLETQNFSSSADSLQPIFYLYICITLLNLPYTMHNHDNTYNLYI